jgi:hypothetical protein
MADERSAEELAGGQSIEERASEEQTELFPDGVIDGHGVSLKSLVKAGQRVEAKCALRRGEVPLRGGLPDPAKRVRLAVPAEAVGSLTKPEREDGTPGAATLPPVLGIGSREPKVSEPAPRQTGRARKRREGVRTAACGTLAKTPARG